MMEILESQLRKLINHLLIEAKADVLAALYTHIPGRILNALVDLDPSPTKKYLEWMVKVVDSGETADLEKLGLTIREFNRAQQRLQGKQRDINSYKSLNDLQATLKDVGTQSKAQQRQAAKASGSQHVGSVDGWDVYFITSHEAAMLLGKGTKWCITQDNGRHWDGYVRDVKFFYAIRKVPQGDPLDKIAYACYLMNNKIEVFDAQDRSIDENDDSIIELSNFINGVKNSYNTYTVTSKNQTLTVTNNEWSGCVTNASGDKSWWLNGERHREGGPAVEWASGDREWWLNGKLHREGGPAVEGASGDKEWWLNSKRHREGGPAVEGANGHKEWWLNGKRHREGGPAVEGTSGNKEWWLNGKRHREGGPALEGADGDKEWWLNGELHREGGPAMEWPNGHKEWWLKGERYSTEVDYERALKQLGK